MTTLATPTAAHPPTDPDHGVNASTFETLWSGDEEQEDVGALANASALAVLANGTDVPLDTPPQAVEEWSRGDHREVPTSDASRSIAPSGADLKQGRFIKDAHATVFAIKPSTTVLLSPDEQPRYVAPNGSVLAMVDHRVAVPEASESADRQVSWSVASARIVETRLEVNGEVLDRTPRTQRPVLDFSDLDQRADEELTLTVVAEIHAELQQTVSVRDRRCVQDNETNSTECRSAWETSVSVTTEQITVTDSVEVVPYGLSVSGFWARYPNGDLGLVVFHNQPWLGYSVPAGDVRGVWRFYSARDPAWDTLVVRNESGSTTVHSPAHPLAVSAYPFKPGPTATPRGRVSILDAYGSETEPGRLPAEVHLDALTTPYTASYGLATRIRSTNATYEDVTAYGLVRGVETPAKSKYFVEIPINRSELELSVVNRTDESVTVRARLVDASSGELINTVDRDEYVELAGERVNTSGNGTATRTLPLDPGGITARYVAAPWWHHGRSYTGSSDVVLDRTSTLDPLGTAFRLGVPIGLFLVGMFLIDRITGWRIWPPWRGV